MIEVLKYLKPGAIVPIDIQTTKALVDALRQAIAELESQEPVACGTYQEVTDTMNALWAGTLEQVQIAEEMKNKKLYTAPPQRIEQNFCPRCGKRTNDIHTCTPPEENT